MEGEGGRFVGHGGMREYVRQVDENWAGANWVVREVREVQDERLLVAVRFSGTAPASGIEVSEELGLVMSVTPDGSTSRIAAFVSFEEAERAADASV